ncbi:MAG TPA: response regulator transcription factor [Usitatibacter sp.]|nr:response regulator transcription factor [Usitatibacter sp.]
MHTATNALQAPPQPAATVFIVEDSPSIRERLAGMLERIDGVDVVGQAASANEAIHGILHTRPSSVLLDLQLDSGSGLDVLRAVHPIDPRIVFVVLTNQSEPPYRRACKAAGAAYFLDKTTEFERVREIVGDIASSSPRQ